MTHIVVLGGTGYAGGHIATEAVRRSHTLLAVSRNAPTEEIPGVDHRAGDVRDRAFVDEILTGADVVISALSPRGDMADADAFREVIAGIARSAEARGVRFGVIGGAGSLRVSEDGPKLVDTPDFPEEFADEPRTLDAVLSDLTAHEGDLDWFFVSPAGGFGSFAPGERTGIYRVGGDVLLVDDHGQSHLSGEDLAVAVVDEIDEPAHRRVRFHVAY